MKTLLRYDRENPSAAIRTLLLLFALCHLIMVPFAGDFTFEGLARIMYAECGLVTDTIITGGLGATFMNAFLVTLLCIGAIQFSGGHFGGTAVASTCMTAGFAFFGINPVNMLPVLIGTYLYSLLNKDPFSKNVNVGIFACCTGPIVQYMFVHGGLSMPLNILLGILCGIICGLLVTPCAVSTAKAHDGTNLYNGGFASGLILIGMSAFLKGFGYTFESAFTWYTDKKLMIVLFLCVLFLLWFLIGFELNGRSFKELMTLGKRTGWRCDFIHLDGLGAAMMNMSVLGWIAVVYILVIGGDFSGPVLSGIYSMFAFGTIGKHFKNVVSVMAGIVLLSFVSEWSLRDPAVQFSILLSTCVCPISGRFGPFWGMLAGMVHISIVRQSGSFHSWLNLYNNGFAGGIAATLMHSLALVFEKGKEE